MKSLLVRWAILTAAIWVAAQLLTGVVVTGGLGTYFVIALVFGLINATLGLITKLLTFPFTLLTFGLWNLFINAAMLLVTDHFNDSLAIENIWWGLAMAVIITVINAVLSPLKRAAKKK
jgi:putative membrane protein